MVRQSQGKKRSTSFEHLLYFFDKTEILCVGTPAFFIIV
jgi:hypothetical protein